MPVTGMGPAVPTGPDGFAPPATQFLSPQGRPVAVPATASPVYTGTAPAGTQLFYSSAQFQASVIADSGSTLQIGSVSGLPQRYPYKLLLEWGTANQEVAIVTSAPSGNGPYTFTGVLRGQDGGGPQITHATGAQVNHGVSAADFFQAAPVFNVCDTQYAGGADPTGTLDSTPAYQAALNACAAAGGGIVFAAAGNYIISNLLIDSFVTLQGAGPATTLTGKPGASGYMIALANPASSQQVTVADITLQPYSGTATGSLGGIQLDNTGYPTGSEIFDSRHRLRNVFVYQSGGDSFNFGNNIRGATVIACTQYNSLGSGFNIGAGTTDCFFWGCVSGTSASHGFLVSGGNCVFTGCKAFYAGFSYYAGSWGSTQAGFYLNSCTYNVFSGCSAQQAALHGFDLQSASYCTITGCEADTNSAGTGVTTGVGINTNSSIYCAITSCSGNDNTFNLPGAQAYGYQVAGTQTGTVFIGNTVRGNSGQYNYISGSGYMQIDETVSDFSQVSFYKVTAPVLATDGPQTLSNNSTIPVTSDGTFAACPVTASGNVTGIILQAPNNNWTQFIVINQSAFTMTFDVPGTSHVAGGTAVIIPPNGMMYFVYDGNTSLWVPVSPPGYLAAGTASAAPLNFQSGTLETAAAAGAVEYDGISFYATSAASSRQVVNAEQIQVLSGANSATLTNDTSAHKIFNASTNGALTVQGSTTYEFECLLNCSGFSSSSHTLNFGFGGTATFTSCTYLATGATTAGGNAATVLEAAASMSAITNAGTGTIYNGVIRGTMRINAGGTIIPQLQQVTASAAATVGANSFFRCWPIGSGSVTSVGNWS